MKVKKLSVASLLVVLLASCSSQSADQVSPSPNSSKSAAVTNSTTSTSESRIAQYLEVKITYVCTRDPNPEVDAYQAELFDNSGVIISTSAYVEQQISDNPYETGFCKLTAGFKDVPYALAPVYVKFTNGGIGLAKTRTIDAEEIDQVYVTVGMTATEYLYP